MNEEPDSNSRKNRRKKGRGPGDEPPTYLPDIHRLLPQSGDAEMGVLSSMMLAPNEVIALIEERGVVLEWFHIGAHGIIYDLMRQMHGAQMPIDVLTLSQELRDQELIDAVGGPAFVTELFTFLPTSANVEWYLDILAEKHAARQVIKVCTEMAARAYTEQDMIGELVDEAQVKILEINRPDADASQGHIKHIKTGILESIIAIEDTYNSRGKPLGLATGFHQLDRMTGGMRGPLFIVVAGRPSMGKSALLMNIAEYVAVDCGNPVLVFSLEMNLAELAGRMLCSRGKINLQRVRDGFLSKEAVDRTLPAAGQALNDAPIWVDETAAISIQELRTRVRRFLRKQPKTAAIFIDYIQLMRSTTKRAQENRNLEIGEITAGLKRLAKEINRPIIAAAQLNRDNDGANQKPKLSNLRESGSIEQDADWALLIHRRHYYTKADEDKGKANVDLAKQRNGPTGDITLNFNAELARFENPEGQQLYSNDEEHRQKRDSEEESPFPEGAP